MKVTLEREEFLSKLSLASRFTSSKLSSLALLQGIYFKAEEGKIHLYSSNLNSFFHSALPAKIEKKGEFITEAKKLIEFISFLTEGKIELEASEKQLTVISGKKRGGFPLLKSGDFPLPPKLEGKDQKLSPDFFIKNLPLILFSASSDETRPALSGVNFVTNEDLTLVSTDGFRLSLLKTEKEADIPSVIIPADFLKEVLHYVKEEKNLGFSYSEKEKLIKFKAGETEFYSRLIEGDFPPFEKVIPQERKTTVVLEKEEFLRNVKLISVFARDLSYIVVLEVKKNEVKITPKATGGEDNSAVQEAEVEGEEQKTAFNYKFLVDFLNAVDCKNITIEILRPDAPTVFRTDNNKNFLHIIMPVRIQE